ncbi:MAG: hypothetical protein KY429_04375 [Actinobacteria bacterium]|nr:hypothetical protein [Actinomycetota bacterium]
MAADPEMIRQVRQEADAIVAEAREQAQRLTEAAEARRRASLGESEEVRSARIALAGKLEQTIEDLTGILEELKKQLDS